MFDNYRIILASASPRRRELLEGLDLNFTVETGKDAEEVYGDDVPHDRIPEYLALHKSTSFHRELENDEVLITADTLVFLGKKVLGKPADRDDAIRILRMLSGHTHTVITGVVLRSSREIQSFSSSTEVTFREMSDDEIEYYVDRYKPYDKAGAYAIQEWIGKAVITGIYGSIYNVIGMPTHELYEHLKQICK